MAMAASTVVTKLPFRSPEAVSGSGGIQIPLPLCSHNIRASRPFTSLHLLSTAPPSRTSLRVVSCLPPPPPFTPSTKLFVSGLSFRTTEESLRNAFKNFGQLLEVSLVMDKIANRPKGFAFIRYATEEESQKAIEGMHGKDMIIEIIEKLNAKQLN